MKKEISIKTEELSIEKNILKWEGTIIQLRNISSITTEPLEMLRFPMMCVLFFIIGCALLKYNLLLGIFVIIGGVVWICVWSETNEKRKSDTILTINMNSGENLRFIFYNKDFLRQVLYVLESIIVNGGVGEGIISINIVGSSISGNASILNDFKIS